MARSMLDAEYLKRHRPPFQRPIDAPRIRFAYVGRRHRPIQKGKCSARPLLRASPLKLGLGRRKFPLNRKRLSDSGARRSCFGVKTTHFSFRLTWPPVKFALMIDFLPGKFTTRGAGGASGPSTGEGR
ncbi:hypothetical protein GWI33_003469 [Rhynchophorus ferrugineus]|uniref:Uncharacterized protein n=1 Tax=Rhynchophorus ferrugineus TaxID=354439 RepID=A0A834MF38_RHYFE|nr:hypothetical protein GWI33_003469 [Rhynchophorus ferrugineus]